MEVYLSVVLEVFVWLVLPVKIHSIWSAAGVCDFVCKCNFRYSAQLLLSLSQHANVKATDLCPVSLCSMPTSTCMSHWWQQSGSHDQSGSDVSVKVLLR